MNALEASFPYRETRDQQEAIDSVRKDMEAQSAQWTA